MYNNRSRGFTLIELLVVIAIIGILSAVVLASLNTARSRANNAAVQSNLEAVKLQAEIWYGGTGGNSYNPGFASAVCPTAGGTMFVADGTIARAIAQTKTANGGTDPTCYSSTTAYLVSSPLATPIGTSLHWCIDSTGISKGEANAPLNTATACLP